MKKVLLFSILFCAIALPALGELTEADLNKIRLIIKEEIKTELESFEGDIKEYIGTKNESVEKRLSLVTILMVGLIALVVLAVSIPQILIAWRSRQDRTQKKQIEELTREFEALKQQAGFPIGIET